MGDIKGVCDDFKAAMDNPVISCLVKFATAGTDWVVMPFASLTMGGNWCSGSQPSNFTVTPNNYSGATPECQNSVTGAPTPAPKAKPKSVTCTTNGGNVPTGTSCSIPFTYAGSSYNECTTYRNSGVPWCSTDATYNGNWGNCDCVDAASNPKEKTCKTSGGSVPSGTPCSFPFTYDGTKYTECTTYGNSGVPWCSTEATYNGYWGNCDCN